MANIPSPEELLKINYGMPAQHWMDYKPTIRDGNFAYPGKPEIAEYLGLPNCREWSPADDDWQLPENWMEILHEGMKERLSKYRSFKLFMDICVRCGACADKCHYYIGSGDPKNMPVLRAELMRSIYRKEFTTAGKILGKIGGARKMTKEVVKEWFYYYYQCTECRRCSLYCPYGIDTAEVTMMGREMLHMLGININWIIEPVANCTRTGNHMGIQPHAYKEIKEFLEDDIHAITGIKVNAPLNEKGHKVLFITPSGDIFADPGIYTYMGYMMLFHEIGLDYTWSTYASEGGNFGLFTSHEQMK
ncbi:MAG: (Fe-S)-binding protein, partial [Desulfovibrio sp.]